MLPALPKAKGVSPAATEPSQRAEAVPSGEGLRCRLAWAVPHGQLS